MCVLCLIPQPVAADIESLHFLLNSIFSLCVQFHGMHLLDNSLLAAFSDVSEAGLFWTSHGMRLYSMAMSQTAGKPSTSRSSREMRFQCPNWPCRIVTWWRNPEIQCPIHDIHISFSGAQGRQQLCSRDYGLWKHRICWHHRDAET